MTGHVALQKQRQFALPVTVSASAQAV